MCLYVGVWGVCLNGDPRGFVGDLKTAGPVLEISHGVARKLQVERVLRSQWFIYGREVHTGDFCDVEIELSDSKDLS